MADQPIPNDDLGEWGEGQFRTLCAASGIVANKAERDKMGWDFIVELPPQAANAALPLDQPEQPRMSSADQDALAARG
jgi:hypothetical protein